MGVIALSGTMTCPEDMVQSVRQALKAHIRLSRAEPGCLAFDVRETEPGVFAVSERFETRAAFDAHQVRTRASNWFALTGHLPRSYTVTEE
ncbi:MAG: antibiotic biosynthesis monooxygenase [Roseivivax sp.]|nr:antibiotic biosynthesis monooxygenase [Roseivivax sp.]